MGRYDEVYDAAKAAYNVTLQSTAAEWGFCVPLRPHDALVNYEVLRLWPAEFFEKHVLKRFPVVG